MMEIEWLGRGTLTVERQDENGYFVGGFVHEGRKAIYDRPVLLKDQRSCRAFLHGCKDLRGHGKMKIRFGGGEYNGVHRFIERLPIPGGDELPED